LTTNHFAINDFALIYFLPTSTVLNRYQNFSYPLAAFIRWEYFLISHAQVPLTSCKNFASCAQAFRIASHG
jgi:hypothetical protein